LPFRIHFALTLFPTAGFQIFTERGSPEIYHAVKVSFEQTADTIAGFLRGASFFCATVKPQKRLIHLVLGMGWRSLRIGGLD
jgi:hypothetical protein